MANLFDYLTWRGDVPFSADPFSEVDNLLFSEIAYTDLAGVLPEDGSFIPLRTAVERLMELHSREELMANPAFTKLAPFLMEKCAVCSRFEETVLGHYINEVDDHANKQISAVTFYPGDGSAYIAFRGTDLTAVGWKEDFIFSYRSGTEGQERAVSYLEEAARRTGMPLRVGGHSKGGNFAVYAAAFCDPEVQKRILSVYSNDGPGFRPDVLLSNGYRAIRDRTVSIVPETSIIGMLMDQDCSRIVVKSSEKGIMQHDALSWEILGNHFKKAEGLSELGVFTDQTIRNWLFEIDDRTRASFVDSLFVLLKAGWTDSGHEATVQAARNMFRTMKQLPEEKRKEFQTILLSLVRTSRKMLAEDLRDAVKDGLSRTGEELKEGLAKTGEDLRDAVKDGLARTGDAVKDGLARTGEDLRDAVKEGLARTGDSLSHAVRGSLAQSEAALEEAAAEAAGKETAGTENPGVS